MKRNKQSKVVAIVALCVSVLGLTLGFAAFSNTLTISSSATVRPNSSDFKLTMYGATDPSDENSFTSTTESVPHYTTSDVIAGNAKINNDNMTIIIDSVNFVGSGLGLTYYYFDVVNEGEYDAYITQSSLPTTNEIKNSIVCTAIEDGVSEELLADACKNSYMHMRLSNYDGYLSILDENDSYYMKIAPGERADLEIVVGIPSYGHNGIYADGKFSIKFPDIKLSFSTVEPKN